MTAHDKQQTQSLSSQVVGCLDSLASAFQGGFTNGNAVWDETPEYHKEMFRDGVRSLLSLVETPSPSSHVVGTLDERLKAAGMFTVEEMMGVTPMTRWEVHTGIRDLDTFGQWLDMKVREYLTMKSAYEIGDKDKTDELYEWVLAHAGAYTTIRTNFKAAIERAALSTATEVK